MLKQLSGPYDTFDCLLSHLLSKKRAFSVIFHVTNSIFIYFECTEFSRNTPSAYLVSPRRELFSILENHVIDSNAIYLLGFEVAPPHASNHSARVKAKLSHLGICIFE